MKQRIIFFGSGNYTFPIIQVLKRHGLILVVTTEKENFFTKFLEQNNVQFISSDLKQKADIEKIMDSHPALGVLASYGFILPKKIIELFPKGIINIHPSLLPKYKGTTPIQTAILNGDRQTGVTLHYIDEKMDHGPILAQTKVKLTGSETTEDLKQQLFALGAEMIDQLLQGDSLQTREQDHTQESFTKRLSRDAGFIDIDNPPNPIVIERMVRAYHPWPGVWIQTSLGGKIKRVKLLPEKKIQVEGKKVMTQQDFVNGYQREGQKILSQLGFSDLS